MKLLLFVSLLCIGDVINAAVQNNAVEVYFVVDAKVLSNYKAYGYSTEFAKKSLQDDINFFITQVNEVYKSFSEYGFTLAIELRQLTFLPYNVFGECDVRKGGRVEVDIGIETFGEWLEKEDAHAKLNYDVAVLWTGFELYGNGQADATSGYANIGTVCDHKKAIAIVEFDGTYKTVLTTAHEIGHILGAKHDSSASCPSSSGYVMSSTAKAASDLRWMFSPCSADDIGAVLTELRETGKDCLGLTDSKSTSPSSRASPALLDPDAICVRSQNDTASFMCKAAILYEGMIPQGDQVCNRIYCGTNTSNLCYSAYSTEGLICGVNKRCMKGSCIEASPDYPVPKNVDDDNCLWGDTKSLRFTDYTGTCQHYFKTNGYVQCYAKGAKTACCGTCRSIFTGIVGCEYGDKSSNCRDFPRDSVCPEYSDTCCNYCRTWRGKRAVKKSFPLNSPSLIFPDLLIEIPDQAQQETSGPDVSVREISSV